MIRITLIYVTIFMGSLAMSEDTNRQSKRPYFENSYALVVGIQDYKEYRWTDLPNAKRDAKAFARFLEMQGYSVNTLFDHKATKVGITNHFLHLARKVTDKDRFLFFFSGHGHTERFNDDDWGYIIPYDGKGSAEYISMDELRVFSRKLGKAKHELFILSSCFGGNLALRSGGHDPDSDFYLDAITSSSAKLVITAGGRKQKVVDGGPCGLSLFTGTILKALWDGSADQNHDGYTSSIELFAAIGRKASNRFQTPRFGQLMGHDLGDFIFRVPPKNEFDCSKIGDFGVAAIFRNDNKLGFEFVRIEPGAFNMGFDFGDEDERPAHRVQITKPFYISKFEVTQEQWQQVMDNNPSRFKNNENPVETVSWNDAMEFIEKLNALDDEIVYRLPTEAEWEYVASSDLDSDRSRRSLSDQAWVRSNSKKKPHPVGRKPPNKYGVYDMHGNVWEWVSDYFAMYHDHLEVDPHGPDSGEYRVSKGGSWVQDSGYARPSFRNSGDPGERHDDVGFRIVFDVRDSADIGRSSR